MSIPIINLLDPESSNQIKDACVNVGFFYLVNHGIPQQMIDNAFALSKQFFDLKDDFKKQYLIQKDNVGYSAMFQEKLDPSTQKLGDHKEAFNFGKFMRSGTLQRLPPVFEIERQNLEQFSKYCHNTCMRVLKAFGQCLEIPETAGGSHWFETRHDYEQPSGDILRFLKYPKSENYDGEEVRAGSHTDYGSITLLFQKDIGGLEVLNKTGEWIKAPVISESILVNVGDLMEFWTNSFFQSTKHRVVFDPETMRHNDRYSIAYFCHANDDAKLLPVPSQLPELQSKLTKHSSEDILTAGQHLRQRLDATYTYN
ncbi:uncharacterized protein VTP21DRAFT_6485 [Calcarisporiella thermophila]|uniref:uncharacterized protein n=1 Tax=Calcarisporiella thermophila TaxID=911321 RepID=UPI00374425F6